MKKVNILTKAQISTFIILGLLAFLIFGFIFYALKSTTEQITEQSTEKVLKEILRTESISDYITTCLDISFEKALDTIGKQGGYIYLEQPGSILPFSKSSVTFEEDKVAYLIEPTQSKPPWYPCLTPDDPHVYCGFINDPIRFPEVYSYIFGRSRLPQLTKRGEFSIQEQLESYTSYLTKQCTNFSGLIQEEEFKFYNITEGNVSAEIFFQENDVSVILTYPVTVQIPENPTITELFKFESTAKIRFKKIYEAVDEIIQKDNRYLDYHIIEDTQQGFFNEEELKFLEIIPDAIIIRKISSNPFDDIIIINDSKSKINGNNYIFQFARKNRNPVLDYINLTPFNEDYFEEVIIRPVAKDPDEDDLTYNFSGEYFDMFTYIGDNSYALNQSPPVGYYPTTLSVSDAELIDSQIVEILVCDNVHRGELGKCDKRCNAADQCHQKDTGDLTNQCSHEKTYFLDKCSSHCQLIDDDSVCISSSEDESCTAVAGCHGLKPYGVISSGFCHGSNGCQEFCPGKDLVDTNGRYNASEYKTDAGAKCGCSETGSICYTHQSAYFQEGRCKRSECIPI